jgi:hypothetical protein
MSIILQGHEAGFFSSCNLKLRKIIDYINENKKIPDSIDGSNFFRWYKNNTNQDITYDYFEHFDNINENINVELPILLTNSKEEDQFSNYHFIEYSLVSKIIKKYFSPSNEIKNIITMMEKKYNLNYENILVLFYRGNDKNRETKICDYHEYIHYANLIIEKNPEIKILIQSDETEFIHLMLETFPQNSFYFKDEIRHIGKCNSSVDILMKNSNYMFSKYYLAITIIMSKCKYIICGSGNCSLWIMLYRENNKNVIQNLNHQWILPSFI